MDHPATLGSPFLPARTRFEPRVFKLASKNTLAYGARVINLQFKFLRRLIAIVLVAAVPLDSFAYMLQPRTMDSVHSLSVASPHFQIQAMAGRPALDWCSIGHLPSWVKTTRLAAAGLAVAIGIGWFTHAPAAIGAAVSPSWAGDGTFFSAPIVSGKLANDWHYLHGFLGKGVIPGVLLIAFLLDPFRTAAFDGTSLGGGGGTILLVALTMLAIGMIFRLGQGAVRFARRWAHSQKREISILLRAAGNEFDLERSRKAFNVLGLRLASPDYQSSVPRITSRLLQMLENPGNAQIKLAAKNTLIENYPSVRDELLKRLDDFDNPHTARTRKNVAMLLGAALADQRIQDREAMLRLLRVFGEDSDDTVAKEANEHLHYLPLFSWEFRPFLMAAQQHGQGSAAIRWALKNVINPGPDVLPMISSLYADQLPFISEAVRWQPSDPVAPIAERAILYLKEELLKEPAYLNQTYVAPVQDDRSLLALRIMNLACAIAFILQARLENHPDSRISSADFRKLLDYILSNTRLTNSFSDFRTFANSSMAISLAFFQDLRKTKSPFPLKRVIGTLAHELGHNYAFHFLNPRTEQEQALHEWIANVTDLAILQTLDVYRHEDSQQRSDPNFHAHSAAWSLMNQIGELAGSDINWRQFFDLIQAELPLVAKDITFMEMTAQILALYFLGDEVVELRQAALQTTSHLIQPMFDREILYAHRYAYVLPFKLIQKIRMTTEKLVESRQRQRLSREAA